MQPPIRIIKVVYLRKRLNSMIKLDTSMGLKAATEVKTGADLGFSNTCRWGSKELGASMATHGPLTTGSVRVLDALSCSYLRIMLKHHTKLDKKKKVEQNLEGSRACCAPVWIRYWKIKIMPFFADLRQLYAPP